MAGVKISKLKQYEEVFHDESFDEVVDDMIVPASLGNKTISLKIRELTHYINLINSERIDNQDELIENQNIQIENQNLLIENQNTQIEGQNEKLTEQDNIILENSEFISQLSDEIIAKVNEITALSESDRNEFASIKSNLLTENQKNQEQDEKLDSQASLISINKNLIEELAESIAEEITGIKETANTEHTEIKAIVEENEKITALSLIDLNQLIEKLSIKFSELKENADVVHQQIIADQQEIDNAQNERMNTIEDNINLWEIYSE